MHDRSESVSSLRTVSPKSARYGNPTRVPPQRLEVLEVVETFDRSVDLIERINNNFLRSILMLLGLAVVIIFLVLAGVILVVSFTQIGASICFLGKPPLLRRSKGKLDRGERSHQT